MTDRDDTTTTLKPRSRTHRPRRLFVGLAVLASALALVAAGPTGIAAGDDKKKDGKAAALAEAVVAAPYTPVTKTLFNNPQSTSAAAETINDEIDRLIDGTPGGGVGVIRIATYLFDIDSTADKLIAAFRRGVRVQLLVDDGENSSQLVRVRNALGTNKRASSFVTTCRSGCHQPSPSIIHSKMFVFSHVGAVRYVSLITSANPFHENVYDSWNNSHQIVGNTDIYYGLWNYFNAMLADTDRNAYTTAGSGTYRMYFFPKTTGDPVILDSLQGIACTPVASGYGKNGRTHIRVAMWGWSGSADGLNIAKQLNALHQKGCVVDILLNKARTGQTVFSALLKSSPTYGKINIYDGWYDANNNDIAELYVHHKYITISGNWNGHRDMELVYTGSQNFTDGGLRRNNELTLRIHDNGNGIHHEFGLNFNFIRDNHTKGKITSVPAAEHGGLKADGLDSQDEIERLIDPNVGWYVPPGQDVDNDR